MPGSANFIGEFYILNGLFQAKIVFALIAISGVAMSAYYALRLYQRTMHNRRPDGVPSREIGLRDGLVLVPLVLCILGLALYPQLILHRTDRSVSAAVAAAKTPAPSDAVPASAPTSAEHPPPLRESGNHAAQSSPAAAPLTSTGRKPAHMSGFPPVDRGGSE
jgi:NADH-quinone oxidoreductase subunit M